MDLKTQETIEDVIDHYHDFSYEKEYRFKTREMYNSVYNNRVSLKCYRVMLEVLASIHSAVIFKARLDKEFISGRINYLETLL